MNKAEDFINAQHTYSLFDLSLFLITAYSPHIVIHIFVSVVMTTEKPDLTTAEK